MDLGKVAENITRTAFGDITVSDFKFKGGKGEIACSMVVTFASPATQRDVAAFADFYCEAIGRIVGKLGWIFVDNSSRIKKSDDRTKWLVSYVLITTSAFQQRVIHEIKDAFENERF